VISIPTRWPPFAYQTSFRLPTLLLPALLSTALAPLRCASLRIAPLVRPATFPHSLLTRSSLALHSLRTRSALAPHALRTRSSARQKDADNRGATILFVANGAPPVRVDFGAYRGEDGLPNEGRLLKYARSKGDPRMVVLGSLQFRPAQFDALCLSRKACALVVTTGPLGSAYREIVQKLVKMHRTVRRFQSL